MEHIKKFSIQFEFDTEKRDLKFTFSHPEDVIFTNAEILGFIELFKHSVLTTGERIFEKPKQ